MILLVIFCDTFDNLINNKTIYDVITNVNKKMSSLLSVITLS